MTTLIKLYFAYRQDHHPMMTVEVPADYPSIPAKAFAIARFKDFLQVAQDQPLPPGYYVVP